VFAASPPVNKNVSTGAVLRAKCGTKPGDHRLPRTIKPLVQLLSLYTYPESHNAQRYRQTDGQNTWCCQ